MGAGCCCIGKDKVLPVTFASIHKNKKSEEELKGKKEFQRRWEQRNSGIQTNITVIWGLAMPAADIHEVYMFDNNIIGAGFFGSVCRAKRKRDFGQNLTYAVKTIQKSKIKGNISLLRNELELLRSSDHPNIVKFYEVYQDATQYHFVMEYCQGGDITKRIQKDGPMNEKMAMVVIYQVLLAINNLHSCGIVHRDIKPDNFLFKTKEKDSPIRLTDFGLSKRFQQGGKMTTMVGTPLYVAPEVVDKRGYTEKCDIWSIGVMLYLLLTADFPFGGSTKAEIFEKARIGEFSMKASTELLATSEAGKILLKQLLDVTPSKRPSAREALRNPWFDSLNIQYNHDSKPYVTADLIDRLKNFHKSSNFRKEVARLTVESHPESERVIQQKKAFFYVDILNNGVLTWKELKNTFSEFHEDISDIDTDQITKSLELRSHNAILLTDFVAASIEERFYEQNEKLKEAFTRLDIDQDDFISPQDIYDSYCRSGYEFSKPYINSLIKDFDRQGIGKISFDDFVKGMTNSTNRYKSKVSVDMIDASSDKKNDSITPDRHMRNDDELLQRPTGVKIS